MPPRLASLDHLVLTVADLNKTLGFYRDVLGMHPAPFGEPENPRWALYFGAQKINLHVQGHEFDPKAQHPLPGSADLCFLSDVALSEWQSHLAQCDVPIEVGPVARTGATGPITSLYIRDPDRNLIEIAAITPE